METQLSKYNIEFERFPATYIESRDELLKETSEFHDFYKRCSDRDELKFKDAIDTGENFNYIKGAMGSCISHTLLFKKLSGEDFNDPVLILEDDCVLTDGWIESLGGQLETFAEDWDLIRCTWSQKNRTYIRKLRYDHQELKSAYRKTTSRYGGAHFTLVNHTSIKKVYDYMMSEYVLPTDALYTSATKLRSFEIKLSGKVDHLPGHLSDCDPDIEH